MDIDAKDKQTITPKERLKLFEANIKSITDFDGFVILTAREGAPIFLGTLQSELSEEEKGRQFSSWIEVNTAQILLNRENKGLSNELAELFTKKARTALRKHIPEDLRRGDFLSGMLAGFMRKHVVSPEQVLELLDQKEFLGGSHN